MQMASASTLSLPRVFLFFSHLTFRASLEQLTHYVVDLKYVLMIKEKKQKKRKVML